MITGRCGSAVWVGGEDSCKGRRKGGNKETSNLAGCAPNPWVRSISQAWVVCHAVCNQRLDNHCDLPGSLVLVKTKRFAITASLTYIFSKRGVYMNIYKSELRVSNEKTVYSHGEAGYSHPGAQSLSNARKLPEASERARLVP